MIRSLILASALLATAFAAAQAAGPRLLGGGENAELVYEAPSTNLAGGGIAQVTGGGEDLAYSHATEAGAQRNAPAMLLGGGEDAVLVRHGTAIRAAMPRG
ncbi:hypothetical protein JYK14_15670 [Siccirubricoccus sp. KC 17139]|uniref:Uncharacterized protein n=1 Tax=Siccirubricoccus soli TaxID=2899147 RepID=A0ABT1D6N7_9PROT|nr:hypothetical protein [Siccirubricoccus soli]MCO6417588.1 hypothetical protein [Siccirubricoccus soli]MCP2683723.1 hypothetical protein [Siccirubricoccus soli]